MALETEELARECALCSRFRSSFTLIAKIPNGFVEQIAELIALLVGQLQFHFGLLLSASSNGGAAMDSANGPEAAAGYARGGLEMTTVRGGPLHWELKRRSGLWSLSDLTRLQYAACVSPGQSDGSQQTPGLGDTARLKVQLRLLR